MIARNPIARIAIVGAVFAVALAGAAEATSLRGAVVAPPPLYGAAPAGISVMLSAPGQPLRRTVTGGSGLYFFSNVPPGNYVLRVGSASYNVKVMSAPNQDIAPVVLRR